jgi:hypothetical protein
MPNERDHASEIEPLSGVFPANNEAQPKDLSREQLRDFLIDFLDLLGKTPPPAHRTRTSPNRNWTDRGQ